MLDFCAKIFDEKKGERIVYGVSEKNEARYKGFIQCLHLSTPIVKAIKKAHSDNQDVFKCNGVEYILLEYKPARQVDFTKFDRPQEIVLYRYTCRCIPCFRKYDYDAIENINALIPTLERRHKPVSVDIQKCSNCNKFLTSEESLKVYEKKYGTLLFERIWQDDIIHPHSAESFDSYNPDTILSRYGYSAGEHEPGERTRRLIIAMLIDSGLSSKHEIKTILGRFIAERGDRCWHAVEIWQNDLFFTNEYNKEYQRMYSNCYIR